MTFGNDVEFKELGGVLQRTKGTPITAKQMSEINKEGAPIKIFGGGRTVAYVDYGDIPQKDVITKESIVVKSRGIIAFEYIDKPFSLKRVLVLSSNNQGKLNTFITIKQRIYFQSVGQKCQNANCQLDAINSKSHPSIQDKERIVAILQTDALVNDI